MDKQELKRHLNKLRSKYINDCRELRIQFALEHNPVKIGDIVSHTKYPKSSIKVTEIKVPDYGDFGVPECLYVGNVISQNGSISDTIKELYQNEVNLINESPYIYKIS